MTIRWISETTLKPNTTDITLPGETKEDDFTISAGFVGGTFYVEFNDMLIGFSGVDTVHPLTEIRGDTWQPSDYGDLSKRALVVARIREQPYF